MAGLDPAIHDRSGHKMCYEKRTSLRAADRPRVEVPRRGLSVASAAMARAERVAVAGKPEKSEGGPETR